MPTDKLDKLKTLWRLLNDGTATGPQIDGLVHSLTSYVKDSVKALDTRVDNALDSLTKKIDAKLAAVKNGKDGRDGKDGVKGDKGERGERGEKGPKGDNGKDVDPDAVQAIDEKLEDFEKRLQETLPRGVVIGPSRGIFLYIDGVKKGLISNANLKAGTGVSLAYSKVAGQDTITINASGGGEGSGVTVETPPETPDAVTTVFTVSAEPKWIVADGATYYDGAGYTYAALQVAMDVPPSSTIRAII